MDSAIAMGQGIVALIEGIDFWDTSMTGFECLGEVYRLAGRTDAAVGALRQAIDVCERKGAVAMVEQLRGKLAAVGS
jgi:tRNA U38,U39,U40 pseudouridine synthase TruA